jgi:hypothetical protein
MQPIKFQIRAITETIQNQVGAFSFVFIVIVVKFNPKKRNFYKT